MTHLQALCKDMQHQEMYHVVTDQALVSESHMNFGPTYVVQEHHGAPLSSKHDCTLASKQRHMNYVLQRLLHAVC